MTTQTLPGGEIIEVPCDYVLFRRAAAGDKPWSDEDWTDARKKRDRELLA